MQDQFGNEWTVTMKTWQNVVAGQHRPTFVLENTMTPFRALGLRQGHSLAICEVDGRLQMRNDIPAPNARAGPSANCKTKASARFSVTQRTIKKPARKACRSASMASTIVAFSPFGDTPGPSSEDLAAATALVSMSSEEHRDLRSEDFHELAVPRKDVSTVNQIGICDKGADDEGSQTSQGLELNRAQYGFSAYNQAHCYINNPAISVRKPVVQSGGNVWPVNASRRYHQLPPADHSWSQNQVCQSQLNLGAESRIWQEISNLLTPRIVFAASQALMQNSHHPAPTVCPERSMFTSQVVAPSRSVTLASTAIGNLW